MRKKFRIMLTILYEDPQVIVVEKPSGIESQSAKGFEPDMVSLLQNHIWGSQAGQKGKIYTKLSTDWGKRSTNQGKKQVPYVAVIHRLDKPVSGVMVYGKTPGAAAFLSKQAKEGKMDKVYYGVVCGKPVDSVGNFVDYLKKDGKSNRSITVDKSDREGKYAKLEYQTVETITLNAGIPGAGMQLSLVKIRLLTGRHHQIRVQFAERGMPLWGDNRYNPDFASGRLKGSIALCAARLSFDHPSTGKRLTYSIKAKGGAFGWFPDNAYEI